MSGMHTFKVQTTSDSFLLSSQSGYTPHERMQHLFVCENAEQVPGGFCMRSATDC